MREAASQELSTLGRRSLPQLREAAGSKDVEAARRAKMLIERIEEDPAHRLPAAALRLLAMRKPAGAVEALLAYLPHAEDESLTTEVQKSLAAARPARRQARSGPDASLERSQIADSRRRRRSDHQRLRRGGPCGRPQTAQG